MRFFNTEGPVRAEDHYIVPPLGRLDLDEVLLLIERKKYFALHAPRQTGKTSALLALRDLLNGGEAGPCRAVYVNVEGAQAMREDVGMAMRTVLSEMAFQARSSLGDDVLDGVWPGVLDRSGPAAALRESLSRWAGAAPTPLVLMIDEIDALVGDSLLSVLRQLRAGYPDRPERFPQSVILCGVRDVRGYRIRSSAGKAVIAGGSAFNIRAESLRLGDFMPEDVLALLDQHVRATGQEFTAAARDAVWELTRGQPWLVNALAYEACFRNRPGRDRSRSIDGEAIQAAREQLILRRETHLDQLADKLQEERVRRVIEPLLAGGRGEGVRPDDLQYTRDLGLVRRHGAVAIANPIYREVIPRDLTWITQEMAITDDPAWYVGGDGRLEVSKLLAAFQEFFREHSEHWVERFQYKEAGPQLLLQAFLQRVVNGGGRIEREYGLGRGRTDLLIVWPLAAERAGGAAGGADGAALVSRLGRASGTPRPMQKAVVECKLLRGRLERALEQGLQQTRGYMDRCGSAEGHLVIFDRDPDRTWEEKLYRREESVAGAPVTVWGM